MTRPDPDTYRNYVYDLGPILMDRARAVLRDRTTKPVGTPARDFDDGQVLAFNQVISIMQQQAQGLGIPLADLRLGDIVPDRDLI